MPTSSSERPRTTTDSQNDVLAALHPRVQDLLLHHLGWRRLHPVQVSAARPILRGDRDVIVVAGTASGKTEAAWFPVLSRILADGSHPLGVLCLTPLKALIDDQVRRLSCYGDHLDLAISGWHGDIAHSKKMKALETPPTGLVITPESLQGLLLRCPQDLLKALAPLRYVIIDEVHAFAGTDRGHQVQSLLDLLDVHLRRRIPRIALSATVSDIQRMKEYLRPGSPNTVVEVVESAPPEVDVRFRVVTWAPPKARPDRMRGGNGAACGPLPAPDAALCVRDTASGDRLLVARHLDQATRGRRTLVFADSRRAVEEMTALLRDPEVTGTCRSDRYLAHHGSLSKELRQRAEHALREEPDAVVVCTSTLELGIDLPGIDQVAQLDASMTVAGLRQRLGRCGRRKGAHPVLQVFATALPDDEDSLDGSPRSIVDRLQIGLVQALASVELIVAENWVEPTDVAPLGLSTLVHQTLALLRDPRGLTAQQAWSVLCSKGPWRGRVDTDAYALLLRSLAQHKLIRQEGSTLLLDEAGHRLVQRRDFCTVFATPAEYTLQHKGKEIGTLPVSYLPAPGSCLVLGGRTWQVTEIHAQGWVLDVVPDKRGVPPRFSGSPGRVHRRVRQTMRALYEGAGTPSCLDDTGRAALAKARDVYAAEGLDLHGIIAVGDTSLIALWTGDRELNTIRRWIETRHPGRQPEACGIGLRVRGTLQDTTALVRELLQEESPEALDLVPTVAPPTAKYDHYLPQELLRQDHASRYLDVPAARQTLEQLLL